MKYISSTDLRYKTSSIVSQLRDGESFYLIHRSEVVGEIVPKMKKKPVFDAKKFERFLDKLGPVEKLTDSEREKRYREHLETKYGRPILRH